MIAKNTIKLTSEFQVIDIGFSPRLLSHCKVPILLAMSDEARAPLSVCKRCEASRISLSESHWDQSLVKP